ncbi:MAG: aminotransferase class V-fold PLP-dependent enzyme [Cyclobacteriaceae bacterium]|nr:aminotransferase class V-fold PLP-dependent enzyme [Cyclobacteriaceae bacterium]
MYFTEQEIQKFRNETPGCRTRIHFNNAGASLMTDSVSKSITDHIHLESDFGGYEAAIIKASEIDRFYSSVAKLLNCNPSEIAYTTSATDSFSRALSSIPFKQGDVILTTKEDYISNQIAFLSLAKRFGIKLIRSESLIEGGVDLNDFEDCIKKYKPKVVSVSHIPTNSGLIQPVKEIGEICSKYNTVYLLDACQSVGQMPIDVQSIKCDFLSVTARKFLRGPRGAGFLFVSEKILAKGYEPLFLDMRGADWIQANEYKPREDAIRFEDWETAYALLIGTATAVDYSLSVGLDRIEKQVTYLSDYIRKGLQRIDGVSVHDKGAKLGGLTTFHIKGSTPEHIKTELLDRTINVSTSIRNNAVLDYDEKGIDWTVRASPHYYNTINEVDLFLDAVAEISKNQIGKIKTDLPTAKKD